MVGFAQKVFSFCCPRAGVLTAFGSGCSRCPSSARPWALWGAGRAARRSRGWRCSTRSTPRRTRPQAGHWTCSWAAQIWDETGKEHASYTKAGQTLHPKDLHLAWLSRMWPLLEKTTAFPAAASWRKNCASAPVQENCSAEAKYLQRWSPRCCSTTGIRRIWNVRAGR